MSARDNDQPGIVIPRSKLGADIDAAAKIKEDMARLLRELEVTVAPDNTQTPGAWRRDPKGWKQRPMPGR